jgi:predicted transcriptional regulator of viral defense system/very-short-patch-repair endonuclease
MSQVDAQIALIAERQYGVVSIRRVRTLGLSESQIRRRVGDKRLRRLHRGVYAVGHSQLTAHGRWMAAVIALGPGAVLSHRDAAALWGLRAHQRSAIDVTVVGRARRKRRALTVHVTRTLHPEDRSARNRIPVTSVARTLLDLAEVVGGQTLRRAYEQAERVELLDVRAIEALLGRSNGRRGAGALQALLGYDATAAAETKSELERRFLDLIAEAGLPMPQVNVLVDGFLVDCYWPQADLVIELDSYEFHRGRAAFERDREKVARLKLAGREVIPLTHRQVASRRRWVLSAVEQLLRRSPNAPP